MPTIQTAASDPGMVSAIIAALALASAWVWRQVAWGSRLARIEQRQCNIDTKLDTHMESEERLLRDLTLRMDRVIERSRS